MGNDRLFQNIDALDPELERPAPVNDPLPKDGLMRFASGATFYFIAAVVVAVVLLAVIISMA
jgi:hypothetical protein